MIDEVFGVSPQDIEVERKQCIEEGKDISSVEEEFVELLRCDFEKSEVRKRALRLLDKTPHLPQRGDCELSEPSELEAIHSQATRSVSLPPAKLSRERLFDKLYGAWLGRCAGCLLGKPVEGWKLAQIEGYLKDSGRYPLADYFSSAVGEEIFERYGISPRRPFIESVPYMPDDDDINYTVSGLGIVKRYGKQFTAGDVAEYWLSHLPFHATHTAERVAYRNLTMGIQPPASALFRNPFREWIGAQIRADFWGYISPSEPSLASEFAWRDASISHIKNGIYGEMFIASMLASAYVLEDVEEIVKAGLDQIPVHSRLYRAVSDVLNWGKLPEEELTERVHRLYDENSRHDWCHTISNAVIVVGALLAGEMDFERSICASVGVGFDTDCNGATVGSIVGMVLGARRLPKKWIEPLRDTVATAVRGYQLVEISQLASETLRLIEQSTR